MDLTTNSNQEERIVTTTQTRPTRIGEATIAEFAAGLRGKVVRPGDADYDHERSIWNGAHDRRPTLIARCAGVADVIRWTLPDAGWRHRQGVPGRTWMQRPSNSG